MFRLSTLGRLSIDRGAMLRAAELRPQRLAFLAMLAAAGAHGLSRDQVLGVLWADSDPERARHSLAQMLYRLRREVGADAVIATPTLLCLDPTVIGSDVEDFRAAVAEERWEAAAQLYAGPFLAGFYLQDAAEFERWCESARSAIAHEATRAIEAAARRAIGAGDADAAASFWRRLTQLDRTNSTFASTYIETLLARGDRAAALLHAQSHADVVRRELEMEPEAEILAVIERLRGVRPRTAPTNSASAPIPSAPAIGAASAPNLSPISAPIPAAATKGTRTWAISIAAAVAAALVVLAVKIPAVDSALRDRFAGQSRRSSAIRSPVAVRLYEDGLRAFYQFDAVEASRLFDAAMREDPGFALAAYFRWRAEVAANGPFQDSLAARALAIAQNAGERDRAVIAEHVAAAAWDPHALVAADSLVKRFPTDADVLMRAAEVAIETPRAVALLDSAIALDSAVSSSPNAPCLRCDALNKLALRYARADSQRLADRTLDRWRAMRPADYQPWLAEAELATDRGRRADAEDALRRADSLGAPRDRRGLVALVRHLRFSDVDSMTASCAEGLRARREELERYQRLCTIGLRMQGRYRDALGLARGERLPGVTAVRHDLPVDSVQAATIDIEMQRPTVAAEEFAALADARRRPGAGAMDGAGARATANTLTLLAMASAMARDTLRVRGLIDSVALIGHRSLDPRDPLLHHILRGLVSAAAGEHERAVVQLRAAAAAPLPAITRVNYEMGKSLLALHRPGDAIPVLRAAFAAGVDGPALFLTTTEVHELLAQAFVAANQPDSASAHYTIVERCWRSADSLVIPRYEAARQWLLRSGAAKR